MEISEERIRAAYEAAEGNTKEVLAILLGKENKGDGNEKDTRPVTERIRTFEDACRELGDDHPYVKTYNFIQLPDENFDEDKDIHAYLRLRIITAALNEGWKPKFEEGEWRYWPWYYLYKSKEDAMDDNQGNEERVFEIPSAVRCVRWGGNAYIGAGDGFAIASSNDAPSSANTTIGSRLCFKTRELAVYAAKTFCEDWLTFYCL